VNGYLESLFSLQGKAAIVTGCSRGIGAAIAKGFVAAGATVVGVSRSAHPEDAALASIYSQCDINDDAARRFCDGLGGKAAPLHMNVADAENVQACLDTVLSEKNAIDILVNNAAIAPKVDANSIVETSRLENFPLEQWQFQLDVGLTGAFLCSKYFE